MAQTRSASLTVPELMIDAIKKVEGECRFR